MTGTGRVTGTGRKVTGAEKGDRLEQAQRGVTGTEKGDRDREGYRHRER